MILICLASLIINLSRIPGPLLVEGNHHDGSIHGLPEYVKVDKKDNVTDDVIEHTMDAVLAGVAKKRADDAWADLSNNLLGAVGKRGITDFFDQLGKRNDLLGATGKRNASKRNVSKRNELLAEFGKRNNSKRNEFLGEFGKRNNSKRNEFLGEFGKRNEFLGEFGKRNEMLGTFSKRVGGVAKRVKEIAKRFVVHGNRNAAEKRHVKKRNDSGDKKKRSARHSAGKRFEMNMAGKRTPESPVFLGISKRVQSTLEKVL